MGQRFFPLDKALGLLGGAYTPQVQETITRLGSRMPYREAREELRLMWKVDISESSVRHVTMRHGAVAAELIEQEAAYLQATAPPASAQPERMVMCTDGAMVALNNGEWREVKTVTFGEFSSRWDAKQGQVVTTTERVSYFSRVETAESFGHSSLVEWHRRGGENARTVVAVNDGAVWIQGFIDYHCPRAIRVIDFAHALEYVATVGRAIYGAETDAFRQWYRRLSRQLGRQPPQRTVADLRLLQRRHPHHPEAAVIEAAIGYLERRLSMIDYAHFRRLQIPIGSGNVESGHKVVMQKRMKQAGMRWAEASLNPMLALRTALCNQTWASCWQAIAVQLRQEKYAASSPQSRLADQSPQPDLVTENDCQRLTTLADKLAKQQKMRKPWQDHRWIFPRRQVLIHKN